MNLTHIENQNFVRGWIVGAIFMLTVALNGQIVADFRAEYQTSEPPSNWRYLVTSHDNLNDPSEWIDMTYLGGQERYEGTNRFVRIRDKGIIDPEPDTSNEIVLIAWQADATDTYDITLDGYTFRDFDDTGDLNIGLLANDGSKIFSTVIEENETAFIETIRGVKLEEGEFITAFARTVNGDKQLWDMRTEEGAPRGMRISVNSDSPGTTAIVDWLSERGLQGSSDIARMGDRGGSGIPGLRAESTRPLAFIAASDAPANIRDKADHVAEGADDHALIQSVIDAFPDCGGDILLTEGTFEVSAPIEIPTGVNLVGAGADLTLLRLDPGHLSLGLNTGVLHISGSQATVRDLAINGSNPDNREVEDRDDRSSGIYMDIGSGNCVLENIKVSNTTRHGVAVLGKGHELRNIRAEKAGRGYCISVGDGSRARPGAWNIRAEDLFVRDSGGRSGIEINDGVDGLVIDGFYSGGHGNWTRGALHIREHQRDNEYVRNVTIRNGVIDLRDVTVDYESPTRHGFRIESTQAKNLIENIELENIEFRYVDGHGVRLRGNLEGIRLNELDPVHLGQELITVETIDDMTPQNIMVDGQAYPSEN